MRLRLLLIPMLIIALAIALVACGDDDDAPADDDVSPTAEAPAGDDDDDTSDDTDDDDGDDGGGGGGGGGFGTGTGTLTIGDMTFEFTGIGCIFSAEEAQNPDFPFNLSGFAETEEGHRVQLSADIYDPSGEERLEGEGVSHNISIYDVTNLQDPTVDWSDIGGLFGDQPTVITIDGKNIHGEGLFDDGLTDEFEQEPGTMDVECP